MSCGLPRRSSWGSPSSPLQHAMGARQWVAVRPLPSSPPRLLALSACSRSGGGPLRYRLAGRAPRLALSSRGVGPPVRPLGCAVSPSPAARVRRSRPVWGGPLRHCLVGRSPCCALAPWCFVPPCCLLYISWQRRWPCSPSGSLRRGLSRDGGLGRRVPGVVGFPSSAAGTRAPWVVVPPSVRRPVSAAGADPALHWAPSAAS